MVSLDHPHRRYNPLTREWVLVSPHRARRPWLGQVEKAPVQNLPDYDPHCYLCPGNVRAEGKRNADYETTYVFDNDFPALLPPSAIDLPDDGQRPSEPASPIFHAKSVSGFCRVVCFSPRHDLTLPRLSQHQVEAVVHTWTDQVRRLGEIPEVQYVQVFENKGEMMGASNPHPHSQIWSTSFVPNEAERELASQREHWIAHNQCVLCAVLQAERDAGERVVADNQHFTALVPFWAVWPFEILLLSHRHMGALTDLNASEALGLADILRQVTTRYDNLFEISFPYSMGFHQSPSDGVPRPEVHLHAHFYPPLLRSAAVRKFMVGFEMLGMPQRDLSPESAAERLRNLPGSHYTLNAAN